MRILITGPESAGKTTLSQQLSQKLDIPFIPEYARKYLEKNGPQYQYSDLLQIAKGQHQYAFFKKKTDLIFDTHLLNIKIWAEYKFGKCDPWILKKIEEIKFDIILLLAPNLKWTPDPLREYPNGTQHLFKIFEENLQAQASSYFIIDGKGKNRLAQALAAINNFKR